MLTIPTTDLLGCIGDCMPFITPDKDDVAMRVVHLRWDGDLFHASATDGIRAVVSSWSPDDKPDDDVQGELGVDLGDDNGPWEFLLSADDAAHLLKAAKPVKGFEYTPLFVEVDGDLLRVRRAKEARLPGFVITYDRAGDAFPDVRQYVVDAAGKAEPVKEIAWNASLMADFGKVRQRGHAARWTFSGDRSPAVVEIGERFVGALMPVRPREDKEAA